MRPHQEDALASKLEEVISGCDLAIFGQLEDIFEKLDDFVEDFVLYVISASCCIVFGAETVFDERMRIGIRSV